MQKKIIEILADGELHSGNNLGASLGITRAAVYKQITKLKEMGLQVDSVKGVGYCLREPFQLLDELKIKAGIDRSVSKLVSKLEVAWSTPSTNDLAISKIKNGSVMHSGTVFLAEHQSAGRGRRGRQWVSPLGGSLYFSIAWRFEQGAESLEGLSLVIAVAIVDVLQKSFGIKNAKIKWPNDIFVDDKKLGGILIDVMGESGGLCWAVVGVGLNVHHAGEVMQSVEQPWVDLFFVLKKKISRNSLVALLLSEIIETLENFSKKGFCLTKNVWKKYDFFLGRQVVVFSEASRLVGDSKGISDSGGLVVNVDGVTKIVRSGDVSLRCV